MLIYNIPGRDKIEIENIVFDYNGTIAVDGKIIEGLREQLSQLGKHLNLYILTADTYGTVEEESRNIDCKLLTFSNENTGQSKKHIVKKLGAQKTICVGNGFNDIAMFKEAAISIAVIEEEGASAKLLLSADIVTKTIKDAIEIIVNEKKMKAVLRN